MPADRTPTPAPFYVANAAETSAETLVVHDKFTQGVVARVAVPGPSHVERAIAAATNAADDMRRLPPHRRRAALQRCAGVFRDRAASLAEVTCAESGKPIRDARAEVQRLIETFEIAADEAVRDTGELVAVDRTPRGDGYRAAVRRVPIGPCAFVTPFNFPLNLVAHKVAPAVAAGCPFVLKPAQNAPLGALAIAEALASADLPPGAFSVLPCSNDDAAPLIRDDRLRLLSFTGSDAVGWRLKQQAGKKHVVLELGGNAACIVDENTDIADCVDRLVVGVFAQSGQSCISVQRIIAHASLFEPLRDALVARVRTLHAGDPRSEATVVGPLISEDAAIQLERRIQAAVAAGARVLVGGGRRGPLLEPTLLSDAPPDAEIVQEEAFGPVAVLSRFERFEDAVAQVNAGRFGLHAGVFTPRIDRARVAWDELRVGGVVINDVPTVRFDNLPYGGVKDSGLGREGVRSAIEHLTEPSVLITRTVPRRDG